MSFVSSRRDAWVSRKCPDNSCWCPPKQHQNPGEVLAVYRGRSFWRATRSQCLWFKAEGGLSTEWSESLGSLVEGKLCAIGQQVKLSEIMQVLHLWWMLSSGSARSRQLRTSGEGARWQGLKVRICWLALSVTSFSQNGVSISWWIKESEMEVSPSYGKNPYAQMCTILSDTHSIPSVLQWRDAPVNRKRRLSPGCQSVWPRYREYRNKYLCKSPNTSPCAKRHYVR